jgi:hypothetical protein
VSRIDLRRLLLIASAAFALRVGVAVLTEFHPIFPPYYYQDEAFVDGQALEMADDWSRGLPTVFSAACAPSRRALVLGTAVLYGAFGDHPLIPRLGDALLGAIGALCLGLVAGRVAGPEAAPWAASAAALWPSHIFYTSLNMKEAPTIAFFLLALTALLPEDDVARLSAARVAAGVAALVAAALFRSYLLLAASFALAAAATWTAWREPRARRTCAILIASALLAPAAYKLTTKMLYARLMPLKSGSYADAPGLSVSGMIPLPKSEVPRGLRSLLSPAGITAFRRSQDISLAAYARRTSDREVGTRLFPAARFKSWLDVALFLPKGCFYALFMPLPGLYPMNDKPGRVFAALENLVLLILTTLGLAGFARGPKTCARVALFISFLVPAAVSALLEPDLGSATRHKILFLSLLFPFAFEEARRLLERAEPARK